MGVKNLPRIVEKLLENGRAPDTPVALVRWGTTSKQKTVTGTLETIVERVRAAALKAPAIIVVGGVVNLRPKLGWFENRPLLGKKIVVTRARHQASELVDRLCQLGAECLECPTISIGPPKSWDPLDAAIADLPAFDWLVFTSVNGVRFFFERLFDKGKDVRALGHLRTAVIGPATREKLAAFGLNSDIVPQTYRAESVIEAFSGEQIDGSRILLPRAAEARSILPEELTKMGAVVTDVHVYETGLAPESAEVLRKHLGSGDVDMVTFTSSSTVKNFTSLLPPEQLPLLMKDVAVASIGPITSETASSLGFHVDLEAETYTIPGLCDAISGFFSGVGSNLDL
jgi:uroporphyrinogen III methyltransferase/synthase